MNVVWSVVSNSGWEPREKIRMTKGLEMDRDGQNYNQVQRYIPQDVFPPHRACPLQVQVETIHTAGSTASSSNASEATSGGKTRPMLPSPEDITPVPSPPRPPPASPLPPQESKEGKAAPPARGGDKELTPSSGPTPAPPASPLPRIPVPASADAGELKHVDGRGIGREAALPVVAPLRSSVVTPALKKPVGTSPATVAQVNLNIPAAYDDIN